MTRRHRNFAPLPPSRLRIPSGPLSPASPLSPPLSQTPSLSPPSSIFTTSTNETMSDAPPPLPMPWIWQCHKCQTLYPIGATRRCLHDGHVFCSGTTTITRTGRIKRRKACASEYDYVGWRLWGDWKRSQHGDIEESVGECGKECVYQCDFPSECRWSASGAVKSTTFDSMNVDTTTIHPTDDDNMDSDTPSATFSPSTTEPPADIPPPPTHLVQSLQRRSNIYLDKLVRAAEKRTTQLATLLSPIAEEQDKPASPVFGVGLSMPVLDYPSFQRNMERYAQKSLAITNEELEDSFEGVQTPEGFEEAIDRDDDSPLSSQPSGCSSPSIMSPTSGEDDGVFEFKLSDAEDAPTSPRRGAWDWGSGGVGVAVSSPVKRIV